MDSLREKDKEYKHFASLNHQNQGIPNLAIDYHLNPAIIMHNKVKKID